MTADSKYRLGGLAISKDLAHMSVIGRKGGLKISQNKAHMSEIGRKGAAIKKAIRETNKLREEVNQEFEESMARLEKNGDKD